MSTKMVTDGQGGVWLLCNKIGDNQWTLWHASRERERSYYKYPSNTKIAADMLDEDDHPWVTPVSVIVTNEDK